MMLIQVCTLALFVFLNFTLYTKSVEFMEQREKQEETTLHVIGKYGAQDLFTGTSYYVLVSPGFKYFSEGESEGFQTVHIEKEEFDALELGDPIKGHMVDGQFYKELGFFDGHSVSHYIGAAFVLVYDLFYLGYIGRRIPFLRASAGKLSRNKWGAVIGNTLMYSVFVVPLIAWYMYLGVCIWDAGKTAYPGLNADNLTAAMAPVIETESEFHFNGRYAPSESEYHLTISFETEDDRSITVIKEVTQHTYEQYQDTMLPIMYDPKNPYITYLQKTEAGDVMDILTSVTFFLLLISIIVAILLIYTLWWIRQEKKKEREEVLAWKRGRVK